MDPIIEAFMQRGEPNDKFSGIAESRIEKPPYPFAHALRKLFRGSAHPPSKRQNGKNIMQNPM